MKEKTIVNGMHTGMWVRIDSCPIDYTVCAEAVEFDFGGSRSGVTLLTTEDGLQRLLEVGTQALHQLRTKTTEDTVETPVPA
jgi:hypothetical protein